MAAEELVRLRRADEQVRYCAAQRRARIDPNPHQIDAVMFALRRIPEGGCILADEVGLGKTIEAGLVMAQLLAEGKRRLLLIVPRMLLGQWQEELDRLFGLELKEARADLATLTGDGIFVIGRELAGGVRGSAALRMAPPFDLAVIDEAHEIFAGIYRRFDRDGEYREDSEDALTAHRVRQALAAHPSGRTPVLLLTATPIQNSLAELWGLAQFVEPTGTLLGKLPIFRRVFCEGGDDRAIVPEQAAELKRRLEVILQRTLRRQAQEFLEQKFVEREARLFEYAMGAEEKALYDDVTAWLLDPGLLAFQGAPRQLLLLGFHRRMASSRRALADSLDAVAARLEGFITGRGPAAVDEDAARRFALDLEVEVEDLGELAPLGTLGTGRSEDGDARDPGARAGSGAEAGAGAAPRAGARDAASAGAPGGASGGASALPATPERLRAELRRVRELARRAREIPTDAKAERLLQALRWVDERGQSGKGSGKVVIFTESLSTQEYIEELLIERGRAPSDITLFRGTNDRPRQLEALARWRAEVEAKARGPEGGPAARPRSPDVAVRLALVHELRTRSRVLIATEAGAKGLNLQFCDTVVNYDLPWNPQRIEQRIGRCHRYGQTRPVSVISFINRENEAERLLFELLSRKLELFGTVLDLSDAVLHRPSGAEPPGALLQGIGFDFEARLRDIHGGARSPADLAGGIRLYGEQLDEQRRGYEDVLRRTAGLIETRLDASVRQVFRRLQAEVQPALERLDQDLLRLVEGYLAAIGAPYERVEGAGEGEGAGAGEGEGAGASEGDRAGDGGGQVRQKAGRGASSPDIARALALAPFAALPEGFREGARVRVGAPRAEAGAEARGADGEALHLDHPLVRAAVAEARAATARPFTVRFAAAAPGGALPAPLAAYRGRRGRLAAVKVAYRGFEPQERLFAVVLLEGRASGAGDSAAAGGAGAGDAAGAAAAASAPAAAAPPERLPPDAVEALLALVPADRPPFAPPLALPAGAVQDALDEALFDDQAAVAEIEHRRFLRSLEQIDRFLDDQALVKRTERAQLERRLAEAEARRDAALGADARARAQAEIARLALRLEEVEGALARILDRDDPTYADGRAWAFERRYALPEVERVIDAELEIA